jgi:hypothetical protein
VFDLNLLPLNFIADQEQTDLPGLLAVNSPRRAARGRSGDQLLGLVKLSVPAAIAPNELKQLANRMAQAYFETPGSVTAGLRAASECINQSVIDRNLRAPAAGQITGSLNLAVVHGTALFLAHGGTTHTYLLSGQTAEDYFDAQPAGKALGLARPLPMRFYQLEIKPGDELIFCPEPPPTWNGASLAGGAALALDQLLRRLLIRRPADFTCGVAQFQAGSGKISEIRVQPNPMGSTPVLVGQQATRSSDPAPQPLPPIPAAEIVTPAPVPPAAPPAETIQPSGAPDSVEDTQPTPPLSRQVQPSQPPATARAPFRTAEAPLTAKAPSVAPKKTRETVEPQSGASRRKALLPWFARLWRGGRKLQQGSSQTSGGFLAQLLPGAADQPGSLSRGTMVFIAIAIPLIVVIVATTVFRQRGISIYYAQYYAEAQQAAQQAQAQTDPVVVRSLWEKVILIAKTAEPMKDSDDMQTLRSQAEIALDNMDGITRMDYRPAISGGLAASVQVTGLIASGSDLYMLDASKGRVIRATLTASGYEVDSTFRCEPGPSGGNVIGALIGMVPMPRGNEFKAAVMAMDAAGNVLYCIPGEAPLSATLAPPDSKWGKIAAITLDSDSLYILDPKSNAIWVYNGVNGTFKDRPQLFFDKDAPPMADAVDLALNNTDLYLLHADSHLTLCTLSLMATAPTRCSEPAQLSDPRPNHPSPVPVIQDTHFNHILFTDPPDPSIYLLDSQSGSIFHFSLRLNLQKLMRGGSDPTFPLPQGPVTAFTISSNRTAFLAFGSQIYYALIP